VMGKTLNGFTTCKLSEELEKREGVQVLKVAPDLKVKITA